jgi:acetylornithine deacetylase/succinyl-diaminopimelate desuccinylase-like protein
MRRLAHLVPLLLLAAPPAGAARLSPEAAWLADYLRIDTTNPPGREAEAAAFLAARLKEAGIASERHVTPAGRTSLVARLPATTPGAPWIALVHHLDVVPAGDGWTAPPFGGELRDGYLVGRGAIDTKSLGVAHLAALLDAARLPERRRGLLFLAVADEENGGSEGMAWLAQRRPELFANVEAALGEGGLNRTVLGRTFFWGLEVAQKRAYWLALTARGRPGHGSSLNPDSAAHELVRALARLVERPPEWKLQGPVRDFFRAYAALEPSLRGAAFDPDAAVGPNGPAAWVPPGWWGLLQDTAQVTTLAAGERPNVVAGEARARLDLRLLPETDAEAYLAALAATLGDRIAVEVTLATPPSPPSPVGTPVWRALERALADRAPVLPALIPGITDSRFLRQRGVPAYGFSPFELEAIEMRRVHGPDERIPLDRFDAGVARMRRVVRALVSPGD